MFIHICVPEKGRAQALHVMCEREYGTQYKLQVNSYERTTSSTRVCMYEYVCMYMMFMYVCMRVCVNASCTAVVS